MIDLIQSPKLKSLNLKHSDRFIKFLTKLTAWQQLDVKLTFPEFFENLLQQSGYLDWVMNSPDAVEKLNNLNSLFSEIKRLSNANHQLNLSSFLKSLDLMELNHLKLTAKDLDIKTNSVTLTTAHKAKGKEWSHVFIYRCIDKKWGNNIVRKLIKLPDSILKNTDLNKKEKNEDERRLFYVSLTRAKTNLYLSHADRYSSEGYIRETVPSMFLSQLPTSSIKKLSTQKLEKRAKAILVNILTPTPSPKPTSQEKSFLKKILKDFKLSPTALNTYLSCPYKFKLNNLIRVPRAKQSYLSYGTAIHKALEQFYRQFQADDQYPNKEYLLSTFKEALKKEVLTKTEHQIRLKQGQASLSTYFDFYHEDFTKPLFVEKFFGGYWSKPYLNDIPLSGKIDRIDLLDQKSKAVKVVDYKTGSSKTRNQILGNTKDSDGDLFRQLVFYKLLTQLDHNFKATVIKAELDFVEPDKYSNKLKKESFRIQKEHLVELRQTIKQTMKSIRNLNFTHTKDLKHCSRCEYQTHCYPNGLPNSTEQLKLVP